MTTLLTDEQIRELSEPFTWYDGDCERYDISALARAIEQAVLSQPAQDGGEALQFAHDVLVKLSEQSDCDIDPFTFGRFGGDLAIRKCKAALIRPAPAEPPKVAGFKLVPEKLTPTMIAAYDFAESGGCTEAEDFWNYLLKAAPAEPVSRQRVDLEEALANRINGYLNKLAASWECDCPDRHICGIKQLLEDARGFRKLLAAPLASEAQPKFIPCTKCGGVGIFEGETCLCSV